jgi:hypothetical protein
VYREPKKVFVGHAFTPEYLDDFRHAVNEALASIDMIACYADETIIDGHILADKIEPMILQSAFAIFDVSHANRPNVWTEYGWTRALRIPILLTVKQGVALPSDIQGFDRIEYASFKTLGASLKQKLSTAKFAHEGERKLRDLARATSGWTFVADGSSLASAIDVIYGRVNILEKLVTIARQAEHGDVVFGQCKTCAGYTTSLYKEFYDAIGRGVRGEFLIERNAESSEFIRALSGEKSMAVRCVDETLMRFFGVRNKEFLFMLPTRLDEIGIHIIEPKVTEYHYGLFREMWKDGQDID